MAAIFPKKICDTFQKCATAKTDCSGALREIRFRAQQTKKTPFVFALLYVLTDLLKTNPATVIVDDAEAAYITSAIDFINEGSDDLSAFRAFTVSHASFLARNRPLIDYTDFNSKIRSILKSGTLINDDNITAISAQPTSALKGTITVTYASNNMARDRDEKVLEKILENTIGYKPNLSNVKVQGIRVYADVVWIPTIEIFRTTKNDTISDFLDIYMSLKEDGHEFTELDEAEFLDGLCDSISMSCLTQIDTYSFERFINLIVPNANISISDQTTDEMKKSGIIKNYVVSQKLDSDVIAILNAYLAGMDCIQSTSGDRTCMQITQISSTNLDEELVSVLQDLGLPKLVEMLQG